MSMQKRSLLAPMAACISLLTRPSAEICWPGRYSATDQTLSQQYGLSRTSQISREAMRWHRISVHRNRTPAVFEGMRVWRAYVFLAAKVASAWVRVDMPGRARRDSWIGL
jgi:hypothetical protein